MNATMYANANDGYVRSGQASYATARSTGSVDDFNEFGSTLFGSIDYEDFSMRGH